MAAGGCCNDRSPIAEGVAGQANDDEPELRLRRKAMPEAILLPNDAQERRPGSDSERPVKVRGPM